MYVIYSRQAWSYKLMLVLRTSSALTLRRHKKTAAIYGMSSFDKNKLSQFAHMTIHSPHIQTPAVVAAYLRSISDPSASYLLAESERGPTKRS